MQILLSVLSRHMPIHLYTSFYQLRITNGDTMKKYNRYKHYTLFALNNRLRKVDNMSIKTLNDLHEASNGVLTINIVI